MVALILDHSNPVTLVCAIGTAATLVTLGLVVGIAAIAEAVRGRRLRRAM